MMANITFLSFLLFSMRHSIHFAVNTWLNCSFFTLINIKRGPKTGFIPRSHLQSLGLSLSLRLAAISSWTKFKKECGAENVHGIFQLYASISRKRYEIRPKLQSCAFDWQAPTSMTLNDLERLNGSKFSHKFPLSNFHRIRYVAELLARLSCC